MLGVGWTEMLVIGVIALIVIGPKDLPVVMRRIGQFAGTIRRMGSEFQRELNKTTGLDEIRNLRSSIAAPLKQTTDEIRREFNAITPTGVKPSGVIKPADPNVESVVDEIHAAAGMKPPSETAEAATSTPATAPGSEPLPSSAAASASAAAVSLADAPAPLATETAEVKKAPVRAKRITRARPAPTSPVTVESLAPAGEAAPEGPKKVPIRKRAKTQTTDIAAADITPAPEASVLVKKPVTRQRAKSEPQA